MNIDLNAQDQHQFKAWVDGPEDAKYGVVVLQEIFGVNDNIRAMAAKFVEQGYRVICPSLFDRKAEPGLELGYSSAEIQQGLEIKRAISDTTAMLDIEAAAAALSQQQKVFITGYCWGGYLSWRAACLSQSFAAASCWHGGGIVKHCNDTANIPVQMHFGEVDKSIPLSDVDTITKAQPQAEIYVYPAADHAFGREGTSAYQEAAAKLAWQRTFDFFKQYQ